MNDAERIDALEAEIKKLKSCPQAGPGLAAWTDKKNIQTYINVYAAGFISGMIFWIMMR
jgi:hypothetical protein